MQNEIFRSYQTRMCSDPQFQQEQLAYFRGVDEAVSRLDDSDLDGFARFPDFVCTKMMELDDPVQRRSFIENQLGSFVGEQTVARSNSSSFTNAAFLLGHSERSREEQIEFWNTNVVPLLRSFRRTRSPRSDDTNRADATCAIA